MKKPLPLPPPPPPEPPEHLSDASKELYRMVVPRQARTGPRIAIIICALEARDRAEQARKAIEVEGMVSTTKVTGAMHIHPLLKVERECRAQFTALWLGMGLAQDRSYGL